MVRFLDRYDLWGTLRGLARRTKRPRYVAVPYLGRDGAALLSLSRGDVLICALTEQNSKNGSVCPAEIAALQRRGVRVYLQPDLHAKIYLFGKTSIVGSPNLSKTSRDYLDEAALMTTDGAVTRRLTKAMVQRPNASADNTGMAFLLSKGVPPAARWSWPGQESKNADG
jgi:hypothetical protein